MKPDSSAYPAEERALQKTFAERAGAVVWSSSLLPNADLRGKHRLPTWTFVVAAAGAVLVVIALAGLITGLTRRTPGNTAAQGSAAGAHGLQRAPDGWRWESYGGVQATVPSTWQWSVTDARWCTPGATHLPNVGRPGPVAAVLCASTEPPINLRAPHAWFQPARGRSPGIRRAVGDGWIEYLRTVNGVQLRVLDNNRSRAERIMASLQPIRRLDNAGCSTSTPALRDPKWRPTPTSLSQTIKQHVKTLSICRYQLPGSGMPSPPVPLLSSSVLSQRLAAQLTRALADAPAGGGPDSPANCSPRAALGDELIVAWIATNSGTSQVIIRYSGCAHHGIDDGRTLRSLSRPVIKLFLTGPNTPSSGLTAAVADLLSH